MKKKSFWIFLYFGAALLICGNIQRAKAQTLDRVGLLVAYGNGTVEKHCISFSGESLTGMDVLERAGLDMQVSYSSMGAAICKIGAVGCPADDCFCDSPPNFWAYWHLVDGAWIFSSLGASNAHVKNGAVEAWIWGPGQSNPPDLVTFEEICPDLPQPTNTPTQEAPTSTCTEETSSQSEAASTRTPIPTDIIINPFTATPEAAAVTTAPGYGQAEIQPAAPSPTVVPQPEVSALPTVPTVSPPRVSEASTPTLSANVSAEPETQFTPTAVVKKKRTPRSTATAVSNNPTGAAVRLITSLGLAAGAAGFFLFIIAGLCLGLWLMARKKQP